MKTKKDKRGRPPIEDEHFIEEFLEFYASREPYYKPETVPASVMINWVLEKKEKEDTPENRKEVTAHTRQFMPGTERYNPEKYSLLNAFRQKYSHITTFQTHENLSLTASLIPQVVQKLIENGDFTIADLVALVRVNNETAKHIQSEGREDRQEVVGAAGDRNVNEKNIQRATKALEMMKN